MYKLRYEPSMVRPGVLYEPDMVKHGVFEPNMLMLYKPGMIHPTMAKPSMI